MAKKKATRSRVQKHTPPVPNSESKPPGKANPSKGAENPLTSAPSTADGVRLDEKGQRRRKESDDRQLRLL